MRDSLDHVISHFEDVGNIAVEFFGPKVAICARVDQLHVYSNLVTIAKNRALDDAVGVQLLPDLRHCFG
jgi:hypothetical protein